MYTNIKNIIIVTMLFTSLYASNLMQRSWVPISVGDILTFIPKGVDNSNGTIESKDYNQGADINRWYVYANSQKNALSKVYDATLKKNVVSLKTSNGKSIAMQLGNHWNDSKSVISWEQKIKGRYVVYLQINTTKGKRYIVYQQNVEDSGLYDTYYLNIGLPTYVNNTWKTITRDIKSDLKRVESDNTFLSVDRFLVRVYDEARLGSIVLKETGTTDVNTLPIVIIGPSTVYIGHEINDVKHLDNSDCRLEGWGERFDIYTKNPDMIYNYARPGSSSTSFPVSIEDIDDNDTLTKEDKDSIKTLYGPNRDHYWAKVVDNMKKLGKGILLIQYGANEDLKTITEVKFKENIQNYIDKAKELHFIPILITEIERRARNKDGTVWHSRGYFPKWMKEIAADNNLQVLDLNKKSYDEYSKYNDAQWDKMFTDCIDKFKNSETHKREKQRTHYEAKGAKRVASWIRELACEQPNSKLCKQLNKVPRVFTLSSNNFIPEHGSPTFSWKNAPKGTKSFVLIIDDESAKDGTLDWVHWSVININKNTQTIAARTIPTGAKVGINSNGVKRYSDPAYPDTHKYVAHLYALDTKDATNAQFFHGAKNFSLNKKYDHKEFEKVFGFFILGKSEIISK